MTIEEKIFQILEIPQNQWAARWFRQGEVIIQGSKPLFKDRSQLVAATRKPHRFPCPDDVLALGSTGESLDGKAHWIGWDLDVGHGAKSFGSTFVAVQAGRMLKQVAGRMTEIRLSKGGVGVHVRTLIDPMPMPEAIERAKQIAAEARITRMDPTSISRQAHWLWSANPKSRGFELIEGCHE